MSTKTWLYDGAEFLGDAEAQTEFLRLAFETGDPKEAGHALSTVARADMITRLVEATGMDRRTVTTVFTGEAAPEAYQAVRVALNLER